MINLSYLQFIPILGLIYTATSFASLYIKNKRFKKFMAVMQPTLHASVALVALSGLGYIP